MKISVKDTDFDLVFVKESVHQGELWAGFGVFVNVFSAIWFLLWLFVALVSILWFGYLFFNKLLSLPAQQDAVVF